MSHQAQMQLQKKEQENAELHARVEALERDRNALLIGLENLGRPSVWRNCWNTPEHCPAC